MPIRLVCPSCSATLSVKDEYAGRAVKCPKCGGVIPASQPGGAAPTPSKAAMPSLPPPPPPAPPEPPPFETVDEPAKPNERGAGRPTGKPTAKVTEPDGDEDVAKPTNRRGRDDDRDDEPVAPRSKRRRDDAGDEDRPARKRRRGDDDGRDDDDRPAKKKGGKVVLIVAIVCGTLLTCCGGTGLGVYYYIIKPVKEKVEETAQKAREDIKTRNFQVSKSAYNGLEVGETTRTVADTKLGTGRVATEADVMKAFAGETVEMHEWTKKVAQNRVIVWQNGDSYLFAAFHPTADGTARLQAKAWSAKSEELAKDGALDDAKFLQQYPLDGGPGIPVTAVELARAYNENAQATVAKYKNKVLLVEGKLYDLDYNPSSELIAILEGVPKPGGGDTRIRVTVAKDEVTKLLGSVSRGQTVKIKGKCGVYIGFGSLDLINGSFESGGPDGGATVSAAELLTEYAKDAEATDSKYKDKAITITFATVERRSSNSTVIVGYNIGKKNSVKIQMTVPSNGRFWKQIENLKTGDRVTIKGEYTGSANNTININRAWIATP